MFRRVRWSWLRFLGVVRSVVVDALLVAFSSLSVSSSSS